MGKELFIYRITARGLFSEINNLIIAIYYCEKYNYDLKRCICFLIIKWRHITSN